MSITTINLERQTAITIVNRCLALFIFLLLLLSTGNRETKQTKALQIGAKTIQRRRVTFASGNHNFVVIN